MYFVEQPDRRNILDIYAIDSRRSILKGSIIINMNDISLPTLLISVFVSF